MFKNIPFHYYHIDLNGVLSYKYYYKYCETEYYEINFKRKGSYIQSSL